MGGTDKPITVIGYRCRSLAIAVQLCAWCSTLLLAFVPVLVVYGWPPYVWLGKGAGFMLVVGIAVGGFGGLVRHMAGAGNGRSGGYHAMLLMAYFCLTMGGVLGFMQDVQRTARQRTRAVAATAAGESKHRETDANVPSGKGTQQFNTVLFAVLFVVLVFDQIFLSIADKRLRGWTKTEWEPQLATGTIGSDRATDVSEGKQPNNPTAKQAGSEQGGDTDG